MDAVDDGEGEFAFGQVFSVSFVLFPYVAIASQPCVQVTTPTHLGALYIHEVDSDLEENTDELDKRDIVSVVPSAAPEA